MNRLFQLAALGAALLPSAAFAQTPPPGPPPARPQLTDAQKATLQTEMRQSFQQMQQMHLQERTAMLGSLTAAHRAALSSIVGNLAVTPSPDYATAARQIDAILSPAEQRAVLNTHTQARAAEKSLRDRQRQAFEGVLTPEQRTAMDASRATFEASHPQGRRNETAMQRTPDAGRLLLSLAGAGGHREMGDRMMGGPGGPHGDHMMGGPGGPGGPGGM